MNPEQPPYVRDERAEAEASDTELAIPQCGTNGTMITGYTV